MKRIKNGGVNGVFMSNEEYDKLCKLVSERGELIDQLYHVIMKHDMMGIHQLSSRIVEGTV